MPEKLLIVSNYLFMNMTTTTVLYLILCELFPRRGVPALWYSYFFCKASIDACLWIAGTFAGTTTAAGALITLWAAVSGIVSFGIICLSFRDDYVLVGTCAVVCDPLVSGMITIGLLFANHLFGLTDTAGYFVPFGLHTVVTIAVLLFLYALVRKPLVRLLRIFLQGALRHRALWGTCAIIMALMFAIMSRRASGYMSLQFNLNHAVAPLLVILAMMSAMLLRQGRALRNRRKALEDCFALAARYDTTVRAELVQLEQDHVALGGHEMVLERLRAQGGNLTAKHIARLEQTYQRMCTGLFCEQPALDAVLRAAHYRLEEAGATSTISVAGVPLSVTVPVMVVLALSNLACEAAKRAPRHKDGHVNLRIRGIGSQVLVHLDVPSEWGSLWARRYLPVLDSHDTGLIRERREGDRRVVLVICEGECS